MATQNTPKPIHSLVLDTGPIIKNEPTVSTLIGQAEILYTIPAVIQEIRDAVTRAKVENTLLPFLTQRSPRPSSIKVITDFARKTGDLEVLSRPDVHLMALAYELECERNHGDWRLRSVPGQKKINGTPPKSLSELTPQAVPAAESKPTTTMQGPILETRGAWGTAIPSAPTSEPQNPTIKDTFENSHVSTPEGAGFGVEKTAAVQPSEDAKPIVLEPLSKYAPVEAIPEPIVLDPSLEVDASDSEGSDGEGWITPSNLKKHQEIDAKGATEPLSDSRGMQVALLTSDFAMQNVLMRMNLNLLSPTLQRIRQIKTWVMRCHACFYITKDMTKQFCSRCGKDTLIRAQCSTDKDGTFQVHLKKNMQWNTKGNIYSIPKPVAGTSNGKLVSGGGKGGWGQGLILAEDQKEYISAVTGARRQKTKDLMDEDYLPSILTGDRGRAGGRPKVGAGKNVNSRKRK